MKRRILLLACAVLAACATARAQTPWHPTRPVTLVVPYAAGGGTDATARAVAKRLSQLWAQPVVVENHPGADGLIGSRRVMDAKPDGYTLLLQVPGIVLTPFMPGLKGVDPLAALEPVSAVSESPAAIVVSGKLPVKTLPELVRYCQGARRPCTLATGESTARLSGRQLASDTGLHDLVIVNYRGTSPIVQDLIAGNVDIAFTGLTAALPHHRAGTVRIIATQGRRRAAAVPDVPTTAQAGYPQFLSLTWYGMFAPKGTPAAITHGIVAALREAVQDPDVRAALAAAAAEPVVNTPEDFAAQVREERERLGALVRRYPLE